MRLLKRHRVGACLVVATALLLAVAPATAADDGNQGPAGPSKSWGSPMVIPAAAFSTDGVDPEGHYYDARGFLNGDGSDNSMVAPVYLPEGATLNKIVAYVYDNSDSCGANANVHVYLNRNHLSSAAYEVIGYTGSSGASGSPHPIEDDTIDGGSVNNLVYAYWLHLNMCSTAHELYSVVIYYSGA